MSMLAIGVSGLNAAQLGMITTEHNISNANTEGYNRQRTIQGTNIPLVTGSGFVGQGVHVQTVQRMYNGFVAGQVAQSATRASELDTYLDQVTLIDNMLADPSSGLSPALQDFFTGVQQVAADPASLPARQAMISSTEALVARFRSIEQRLSEQYDSVNKQLDSHVQLINSYSQQIAEINQRIVVSQAGTGQPANDLLDQRDTLISQLNDEIRVSVVTERDGSLSVFAGNGQQLVIGVQANTLAAIPSFNDPERFAVAIVSGVNTQELPESVLSGGALGGLLRFRSESLDVASNSLGRVASSMALTFNAQHALGQDLLGNVAGAAGFVGDYFTLSQPKVIPNALNGAAPTPTMDVRFIQPPPVIYNNGDFKMTYDNDVVPPTYTVSSGRYGGGPWAGSDLSALLNTVEGATGAAIDLSSGNYVTDLTLSDYRINFNAAGDGYSVTRLSDNAVVANVASIAALPPDGRQFFDGISIDISSNGAPNATYLIQPTREVARNVALNTTIAADSRLIAAGGPVRAEVGATNTGSGKIDVLNVQDGYDWPNATPPITLSFSGGNLTITNLPAAAGTSVAVTSGNTVTNFTLPALVPFTSDAVVSIGGINFKMTGAPKNGDVFTIGRNTNGVSDSRNALLLGKLQTQDTMSGGKTSYQGAYAQLVSDVGNKTREIQVTGEAQKSLLAQAIAAREAQSGVNLDEEAANLIRYQQAYQAAARVIDVGSRLFDVLISMGR